MKHTYKTENTCSRIIEFELNGDKISNVKFEGGCPGNLQAISKLVEGMSVEELEKRVSGVLCGIKGTSCADQLAKAVKKAYEEEKKLA